MEGLPGIDEGAVISQGRMLKPEDKIYDLVDAIAVAESLAGGADKRRANAGIIYDLVDVVEKRPKMAFVDAGLHDEIMKRAVDIAERIAREVIPDIAERVIREEIEKLKRES